MFVSHIGTKWCWPIRLQHSKSNISPEQSDEIVCFGLYYFTIHDPTIRDPTMHDSCINYTVLCKGGNSLHHIKKLKGLKWIIKIGFIYVPLKLRAEKVKHNFFLIVSTFCHHHNLLVYRINLRNSQSWLSCEIDPSQLYRHNNRHNNYRNVHISQHTLSTEYSYSHISLNIFSTFLVL